MEEVRILVVDDEPLTRDTLVDFFGDMGYRVETASSGEEALEKIEQSFFNVALLDVFLPDMRGTELLTSIRRLHPDTYCIISTGYASKDSSIEAVNEGAFAYIEKPLTPSHVQSVLQSALEKQRLQRENAELLRRLHALNEITDSALSSLTLDEMLRTLLQRAVDYLHAQTSAILLLDAHGSRLDVRLAWDAEGGEASPDVGFAQRVLGTGGPVVVPDVAADPSLTGSPLRRRGIGSIMGVPLKVGDRVIGVAQIERRARHEFTPEEIALVEKFADRAAVLIDNQRLLEEQRHLAERERRSADEARILYEVSQKLVESMRLQDRLRWIATHLCTVTLVSRCTIGLREGEMLALEMIPGDDADEDRLEIDASEWGPVLRHVLERGEVRHWSREEGPIIASEFCDQHRMESALLLPLIYAARVIGVILLDEPGQRRQFTQDQVRLGRAITPQAAVAIQNAQIYERERTVARTLQEIFLPHEPPVIPGFDMHPLYDPAYTAEQIGGDYFDFIELGEGRFGLVLGDVCGKGVVAALFTAKSKFTLRAFASEEPSPAHVVTRLNRALASQMSEECAFVTLVYALLDTRSGTLTYANAAHPPPLVYDPRSRQFQELAGTGGLVGAWPDAEYGEQEIHLPPGCVLALFTDGVTEARRGTQMLESAGVREVIAAHAHRPAREISRRIHLAAVEQSGGSLRDDVAIVVLKRIDDAAAHG
jgi:serine phosphatase RsbU (regulator of sigma subunit)/CheY-like chemotaxis protein